MNRTKSAIIDAFWELLEERPYSKITVQDIVDRCQINRNTFYYHFHDVPELMEDTIKQEADEIIKEYGNPNYPMDCIRPIVERVAGRRKAMLHLYKSAKREAFMDQLERIALHSVTQYVENVIPTDKFSEHDKLLLIRFYKCTFVGTLLDWFENDMKYDPVEHFMRIDDLLEEVAGRLFPNR